MERKRIDNVPVMCGDVTNPEATSRECYLFGALDAALRCAGEPVDYHYLMGVSGCAFRLAVAKPKICASGPDVSADHYVAAALSAVGYEDVLAVSGCDGMPWEDKGATQRLMRESIDRGVPVATFCTFPFFALVVGYEGDRFIIRKYFSGDEETRVIDQGALVIIRKAADSPDPRRAVRRSLGIVLDNSRKKAVESYAWGLAGYDEWIRQLRTPLGKMVDLKGAPEQEGEFGKLDPEFGLKAFLVDGHVNDKKVAEYIDSLEDYGAHWHANAWPYMALIDARSAAARYLQKVTDLFEGPDKRRVADLERLYRDVEGLLRANWQCFPMRHWIKQEAGKIWTPAGMIDGTLWTDRMRSRGADVLEKAKALERKAHGIMQQFGEGEDTGDP